jgi:pyruvate/2-oxoglutarate dehydrogenase complex dihydrolipoamide acyltransferase (E2) component
MARKRAHNEDGTFTADDASTVEVNEAFEQVEEAKAEAQPEPAKIEVQTPSEEPVAAPPAPVKEVIETDVRKKLTSRSQEEDIFTPTSPAVLEAAAKKVAEDEGFELNRGTSIGARLLARSRKMV